MNTYSTTLQISGSLDPSLQKVVGISQKELSKMANYVNGLNKMMGKSSLAMAGLAPAATKATVEIRKSYDMSNKLAESFQRIGEITAGIGISEMITSGLERAVDLGKELVGTMIEFGKEASNAARDYEMRMRGMAGVLHGNKPLAEALMARDAQMAILSPFQGQSLQGLTSELLSSGASVNQAKWLTKKGGDLVAGAGGNAESLDRFANAMSETIAQGSFSGEQAREFRHLHIPMMAEFEKIFNTNAEGVEKLQKKHLITVVAVEKAIANLTGPGGIFQEGMARAADAMQGLETSMHDLWYNKILKGFGDIENEFAKPLLDLVVNSGAWEYIDEYMKGLLELSKGVTTFLKSMPTGELMAKFQPAFDSIELMWARVNNFIGGFFQEVNIPGQGIEWVLNPTGDEKIRQAIDSISSIFAEVAKFVTSDQFQRVAVIAGKGIVDTVGGIFHDIELLIQLFDDFSRGDFMQARNDWRSYLESMNPALKEERGNAIIRGMAGFTNRGGDITTDGVNRFGKGGSVIDNPNAFPDAPPRVYYEHPDTEGHSSQYGPMGNLLGYGYGVGLGVAQQKETGATFGKWVRIRLPNGSTIVRQVNETSSRPSGIEFVTPHTDESSYGNGRATIEGVYDTKPQASAGDTHVHFHIDAIDGASVRSFLDSHGDRIARHVHESIRDRLSATAAV